MVLGCFCADDEEQAPIKVLLLGSSQSGKSTIFKQLRIINDKPYSEKERRGFIPLVRENVIECCHIIIKAMTQLNIGFESVQSVEISKDIQMIVKENLFTNKKLVNEELASNIYNILWSDEGFQRCYKKRSNFSLSDSAEYFITNSERIFSADYVPTQQDILRVRTKTVGLIEAEFYLNSCLWRFIDVGGHREERRNWVHSFPNATALIFIVALNEYDLYLEEDKSINRMHESLNLFRQICYTEYLDNVPIIIFFNKADLLKEKIAEVDLSVAFPEYKGGKDFNKALDFIMKKFNSVNSKKHNTICSFVTTATETATIKLVFESVKSLILRRELEKHNFL